MSTKELKIDGERGMPTVLVSDKGPYVGIELELGGRFMFVMLNRSQQHLLMLYLQEKLQH